MKPDSHRRRSGEAQKSVHSKRLASVIFPNQNLLYEMTKRARERHDASAAHD
jgi:hypothetical protein